MPSPVLSAAKRKEKTWGDYSFLGVEGRAGRWAENLGNSS